jgi:SAM-dependent methyltransferase
VIKGGKLVGEFDDMYRDYADPWNQSREKDRTDKAILLSILRRISKREPMRVVDIGCGLGYFSAQISALGIPVLALDVSQEAIIRARELNPGPSYFIGDLLAQDLFKSFQPTIFVMAETTWYVLEKIMTFMAHLRSAYPEAYFLHALNFLPSGLQKYGREYFTDPDSMRTYFGLHYIEYGDICF